MAKNSVTVTGSPSAQVVGGDAIITNIEVTIQQVRAGEVAEKEALRALNVVLGELKKYHQVVVAYEAQLADLKRDNDKLRSLMRVAETALQEANHGE